MKYLDVIAKDIRDDGSLFIVAFVSIAYLGETVRAELFEASSLPRLLSKATITDRR